MGRLSDTMLDLDEFARSGARRTDPDTSHQAASRSYDLRRSDRREVLLAHATHRERGLTDFELAEIVGRQQTSAGKRRGELRDLGYIEKTGNVRPAPSGSSAIVWRITGLGIRVADDLMLS